MDNELRKAAEDSLDTLSNTALMFKKQRLRQALAATEQSESNLRQVAQCFLESVVYETDMPQDKEDVVKYGNELNKLLGNVVPDMTVQPKHEPLSEKDVVKLAIKFGMSGVDKHNLSMFARAIIEKAVKGGEL